LYNRLSNRDTEGTAKVQGQRVKGQGHSETNDGRNLSYQ